jgi:large subunit ribosomal protein L16
MKQSKGVIKNIETNTVNLDFGTYGLTTLESVRISANQIEAVRKVLSRKMKRSGKIWFRITSKAVGSRMGRGKSGIDFYACYAAAGRILLEIDGVNHETAMMALKSCRYKLPCKTRVVQLPKILV